MDSAVRWRAGRCGRRVTVPGVAYLGVRPGSWGKGIGGNLLRDLRLRLKSAGFTHAELAVYVGNAPATALYERLGWLPLGDPRAHPRTGKPEQRYEMRL